MTAAERAWKEWNGTYRPGRMTMSMDEFLAGFRAGQRARRLPSDSELSADTGLDPDLCAEALKGIRRLWRRR